MVPSPAFLHLSGLYKGMLLLRFFPRFFFLLHVDASLCVCVRERGRELKHRLNTPPVRVHQCVCVCVKERLKTDYIDWVSVPHQCECISVRVCVRERETTSTEYTPRERVRPVCVCLLSLSLSVYLHLYVALVSLAVERCQLSSMVSLPTVNFSVTRHHCSSVRATDTHAHVGYGTCHTQRHARAYSHDALAKRTNTLTCAQRFTAAHVQPTHSPHTHTHTHTHTHSVRSPHGKHYNTCRRPPCAHES